MADRKATPEDAAPLPWATMQPGETPEPCKGVRPLIAVELPRSPELAATPEPPETELVVAPTAIADETAAADPIAIALPDPPPAPLDLDLSDDLQINPMLRPVADRPPHRGHKLAPTRASSLRLVHDDPSITDSNNEEDDDEDAALAAPTRGGGWTIPALCAGLAIVACCTLIPQSDVNRELAYEKTKLQMDLDHLKKQVEVNANFLRKVNTDPSLAERLAHRQMKMVREGTRILELEKGTKVDMNPFLLTAVGPPPELEPYRPKNTLLNRLFLDGKTRLYLTGLGLMLVAFGLVLGGVPLPKN